MIPQHPPTLEGTSTDSASEPIHGQVGTGWIQPSLTRIDLGGLPVGMVNDLYVRYEPENDPAPIMDEVNWAASLQDLADDLQIQHELTAIEDEFAGALLDGLDGES